MLVNEKAFASADCAEPFVVGTSVSSHDVKTMNTMNTDPEDQTSSARESVWVLL